MILGESLEKQNRNKNKKLEVFLSVERGVTWLQGKN